MDMQDSHSASGPWTMLQISRSLTVYKMAAARTHAHALLFKRNPKLCGMHCHPQTFVAQVGGLCSPDTNTAVRARQRKKSPRVSPLIIIAVKPNPVADRSRARCIVHIGPSTHAAGAPKADTTKLGASHQPLGSVVHVCSHVSPHLCGLLTHAPVPWYTPFA